jgi:hypothetical protein
VELRGFNAKAARFSRILNCFPIEKVVDLVYGPWTVSAAGPPWTLVLGAAVQDIRLPDFGQIGAAACWSSPRGVWKREGDSGILTSYQGRRWSGYPGRAMKLKVGQSSFDETVLRGSTHCCDDMRMERRPRGSSSMDRMDDTVEESSQQ